VLARAIRLATDKDTPPSAPPGTIDSSNFTAFQSVPIEKLLSVAKDRCVIFPSSSLGPPEKIISLLQARELAQADLAAAKFRADLEATKAQEEKEKAEKEALVSQEGPVTQVGEDEPQQGRRENPPKKRKVSKKIYPVGPRPLTRQARAQGRVSK
jgi:hypothetical protein